MDSCCSDLIFKSHVFIIHVIWPSLCNLIIVSNWILATCFNETQSAAVEAGNPSKLESDEPRWWTLSLLRYRDCVLNCICLNESRQGRVPIVLLSSSHVVLCTVLVLDCRDSPSMRCTATPLNSFQLGQKQEATVASCPDKDKQTQEGSVARPVLKALAWIRQWWPRLRRNWGNKGWKERLPLTDETYLFYCRLSVSSSIPF